MKVSDLTEFETKVWEASAIGTVVDLRVGNPELDLGDGEWPPSLSEVCVCKKPASWAN